MPYHLSEDELTVMGEDGKPVPGGQHKNKRAALAHLRALEANVADAKSLNMAYVKSILVGMNDAQQLERAAVKRIGADEISGYVALWGNASQLDLDGEYFTPQTDFWHDKLPTPRPLTWEHGQDTEFKGRPVIGEITALKEDDSGLFYTATLERNNKYRAMIDKLIDKSALGTSSDSAPQYVVREKRGKGTWLKQWPLFSASLTASPCEPRMLDSVHFKSIGVSVEAFDAKAAQQAGQAEIEKALRHYELLKRYLPPPSY